MKIKIRIYKVTEGVYADYTMISGMYAVSINNLVPAYRKTLQGALDYVYSYYKQDSIDLSIDLRG